MESSMTKLSIGTDSKKSAKVSSKNKAPIADSWEDAASDSSSSDTETEREDRTQELDMPGSPPPTPVTSTPLSYPTFPSPQSQMLDPYAPRSREDRGTAEPTARPEKQTAVAGRLIAGALGVRASKKTEEQKQYDRAMREKEKKRLERAKAERIREAEEKERQKKEVWDAWP